MVVGHVKYSRCQRCDVFVLVWHFQTSRLLCNRLTFDVDCVLQHPAKISFGIRLIHVMRTCQELMFLF